MAYLAVTYDNKEHIYENRPTRSGLSWTDYETQNDADICLFIELPKGSIKKLIGKELTWDDNPVELVENTDKIIIADKVIDELPKDIHPRIGGSLAMAANGMAKVVNDIDIIVDSVEGIDLPYERLELVHKKRLNDTLSYMIEGIKVDIIERIVPFRETGTKLESVDNILYSQKILKRFCDIVYNEQIDKW